MVSYLAFDMATEGLHIELFSRFLVQSGVNGIRQFDDWLRSQTVPSANRSITGATKFGGTHRADETIPIWIRNKIHHPEEADRRQFQDVELADSIDRMIALLL